MGNDCDGGDWTLRIYKHAQLTPQECDSIYQSHKLGILYPRLFHHEGAEHFDPFY